MNGTELVVAVRLKADGTGVAGQLRLTKTEVVALGQASAEAGGQARTLAAGTAEAAGGTRALAGAARMLDRDLDALAASERQVGVAAGEMARDLRQADTVIDSVVGGTRRLHGAGRDYVVSAGQQRQAAMMVGQQFQDIGIQLSMGTDLLRVAAMQGGQMAFAFDQMGLKGAGGRFAAFMAGPYGAAVLLAVAVGGPFLAQLIDTGSELDNTREKLDAAAKSADSFGDAQSLVGKVIDLNTGKLKTHNSVLVQTIRLQTQLNLLEAQKKISDAAGANKVSLKTPLAGSGGVMGVGSGNIDAAVAAVAASSAQSAQINALRSVLTRQLGNDALANKDPAAYGRVVGAQLDLTFEKLDQIADKGKIAGRSIIDVKTEFLALAQLGQDRSAALQSLKVLDGGPVTEDLKPFKTDRKTRTPKSRSSAARDEFGRDADDRIASIEDSYNDVPSAFRQAEKSIRQLDDLIDDLGRKKPPNFEALIQSAEKAKIVVQSGLIRTIGEAFEKPETLASKAAEAFGQLDDALASAVAQLNAGDIGQATFDGLVSQIGAARDVVEDGLARPFNDFVQAQGEALQIQRLLTAGKDDEAEAQRVILQLEKDRLPLSQAQKDVVLARVQALRAEQRETDALHRKQQAYLNAIGDVRSLITATIEEGAEGLEQLPDRLLSSFKRFFAEWATERFFGGALSKLEEMATGSSSDPVKQAGTQMAGAIDATTPKLNDLGRAVELLTGRINSAAPGSSSALNVVPAGSLGRGSAEVVAAISESVLNSIVVTGRIAKPAANAEMANPKEFFRDAIAELAGAVGIDEETAKQIGTWMSKGLEGAFYGQLASGLAGMLGIKQSGTGAGIGGALGGAAFEQFFGKALGSFAGPLGGIVGGLLGGTLGSLFSKPAYGTATISNTSDAANVSGRGGAQSGASTAAGAVQEGLKNIADRLGGTLGKFAVSIGTFDGKWRVDTAGRTGSMDSKNMRGVTDFGKDGQAAATAFAIADAIADGAVQGLSAAVQAALRSSTNVEDALEEALKVADLEKLLGGLAGQLKSVFDEFDRTAAERVDLARKYGLDLLQVEKINAEQRADLLEKTMQDRVGDLQDMLDNIRYGDLFEGTAAERRSALLTEIEDAREDVDAGVDGAASRLAELRRQLITTSRDAYGTAGGEYGEDRASSIADLERVIEQERDRVAEAAGIQRAQLDAMAAGNALADETNDHLAKLAAKLDGIYDALNAGGSGDGLLMDLVLTKRGG